MGLKFPMNRKDVAVLLGRPYTTIVSWTSNKRISADELITLRNRSEKSKRKPVRNKKDSKKDETATKYWHPSSGGVFAEELLLDGAHDVQSGDVLYKLGKQMVYQEYTVVEIK